MQTQSTRHLAAFAAALALALVPATASAVLERVGPNRPDNFLPAWYQDTTGLTMEFCTPETQAELDGGWCLILPVDVPGGLAPEVFPNAFSGEHFYWASDVVGDWQYTIPAAPGQTPITITSRVLLVQAIEAAFLGDIGPGLGQVFGRIRMRVLDLPLTGIYKFYTPWGIKEVAGLAGDRIFDTEDIGINCPPFQYDCALETSIGPFLVPSATPGGAELPPTAGPSGGFFLSDPGRVGPVTGSPVVGTYNIAPVGQYSQTAGVPTNPNVYAIEAPDGQVIFKSHDFSTVGRVWTAVIPGRVKSDRASYARDAAGATQLHAFATGEPTVAPRLPAAPPSVATQPELHLFNAPCTGTVDPTGNLLPPYGEPVGEPSVPMSRNGNLYFATTAPAAVPAGVCVKDANARTAQGVVQPTYTLGSVTDQVFVTAAVYDPSNGGSLSVRASSSDEFAPPLLSVGAFGTLLANVPLTEDLAFLTPMSAPPEHVRVHSQEGGTAELLVKVGSRRAAGVALTADRSSPQLPGNAVVFTAQGSGATEYLYRFLVDAGAGFQVVRDWATSPAWALGADTPQGHYRVMAEVWAGLQPSPPDAASAILDFDIRRPVATGVTLAADRISPAVINVTAVPTTFTAQATGASPADYQYRFSTSTDGGTSYTVQQAYGASATWVMPAGTPAGSYRVKVDVRTSPAVDSDVSTTLDFLLQNAAPASGVGLAANRSSPQPLGTAVTFTASGQGSAGYHYRFLLRSTGGAFAEVRPYGADPTWTLPSTTPIGAYEVQVEVRADPTSPGPDATSTALAFAIREPAATAVSLTPSRPSPGHVNITPIETVFTAQGSGSAAPYQYRFSLKTGTGPFVQQQDYGPAATWALPASTPPGSYQVKVDVRTSAAADLDATTTLAYQLVLAPPATGVTLTPSLPSPAPLGTAVTFTAQGQGSSGYEYEFWRFANAAWTMVQPFGPASSWTLPSSTPYGQISVMVRVRTKSTVTFDLQTSVPYQVGNVPATGLTLTPSAASPQLPGTPVTFTAQGQGGTGSYQYSFWVFSNGAWALVQPFGASNTWTLPGWAAPGSYQVAAQVRTNATVAFDRQVTVPFQVGSSRATGVTLSASPSATVAAGTPVTLQAQGTGGSGTYKYQFWLFRNGAFELLQAYGTASTCPFPAGAAPGSYPVTVQVRTNDTSAEDARATLSVTIQ